MQSIPHYKPENSAVKDAIARVKSPADNDGLEPTEAAVEAALADYDLDLDVPAAGPVQDAPQSGPMLETLPGNWYDLEVPPREFVFQHRVPLDVVTLLAAAGGTGKSTLALELAASAATGRALLPCFQPTAGPSRVAVLSLEDDAPELMRRLKRVVKAFRLDYDRADLHRLAENTRIYCPSSFYAVATAPDGALCASVDLKRLSAELAEFKPRLVIMDPLAALLGGLAEENSNEVAQRVTGLLRGAMPPGAGLLLSVHCAKMDRATGATPRGAGAWSDAARQVLSMRPPDDREARVLGNDALRAVVLAVVKSNYSALSGPIYLMKSAEPETAGVLRGFDFHDYEAQSYRAKNTELAGAVLDALRTHPVTLQEARGCCSTQDGKERGEAFRDAVAARLTRSISRNDLGSFLRDMQDRGTVAVQQAGQRRVLVPVDTDTDPEDDPIYA